MAEPRVAIDVEAFGTCPVPQSQYDRILLGHGSGGQLTADLIQRLFVPGFGNDVLAALEDQATLDWPPLPPRPPPPRRGGGDAPRAPPPLRVSPPSPPPPARGRGPGGGVADRLHHRRF